MDSATSAFREGATAQKRIKKSDSRWDEFAAPRVVPIRSLTPSLDAAAADRTEAIGARTMKLLLIEDDARTAAHILRGFREQGHVVDHAGNGRDGLFMAGSERYDVEIVDRTLPGMDGLAIVKMLRSTGVKTPVLMISERRDVEDRVEALESGADDYLLKPLAFSELAARTNALARRPPLVDTQTVLRIADLEVDLLKRSVRRGSEAIELQPREFSLFTYLLHRIGQVVTRTMLLEGVWHYHFDPQTNIVETHICRLRAKIDRGRSPTLIRTIRGAGYTIHAEGAA